ncbi:MAG: hypothetical protein JWN41_665 [Thermoleophilia bacterium]|nr:hypothetical protein [Thermoleophilia bacterium]
MLTPPLAALRSATPRSAQERIQPLLGAEIGPRIPDVAFDTRIGRGTVASEFDRAVRVRLEGSGPASTRTFVPETTTAQKLFASPAGPRFERLLRASLASIDAANGSDDLHHITLAPDEHSVKGVEFLSRVVAEARTTPGNVRFTSGHWSKADLPAAEARSAARMSRVLAHAMPREIGKSTLAWNGRGDVVLMPDASRDMLASVGAYRPQDGDPIASNFGLNEADVAPESRPYVQPAIARFRGDVLRQEVGALVHEAHHSPTPLVTRGAETTRILEESVAQIFAVGDRARVQRAAGIDTHALAADPTNAPDLAKLGWKPWNRSHLPKDPVSDAPMVQHRYVDGPQVVRDLLHLYDVDLRTKDGRAEAFRLLQTVPSDNLPRFLARELITRRGLDPSVEASLADRIRRSVASPSGAELVSRFLAEQKPQEVPPPAAG